MVIVLTKLTVATVFVISQDRIVNRSRSHVMRSHANTKEYAGMLGKMASLFLRVDAEKGMGACFASIIMVGFQFNIFFTLEVVSLVSSLCHGL